MSVINDVLKDLETRESRFIPIEINSVESSPRARRDRVPILLGLMLLPLLAAAFWYYLQQQQNNVGPLAQAVPADRSIRSQTESLVPPRDTIVETEPTGSNPVRQPPAATDDKALAAAALADNDVALEAAPGNQIVGLQIRESEQEMRMEFVLTEKVVAYLRERGENSFGYHLRNIESQIDAPLISNNPWIRTLDIETGEEGVDIRFETAAEILVETRQKFVDDEPVWAISLRKAAASPQLAVASAESNGQVEEPAVAAETETPALVETAPLEEPPVAEVKLDIKTSNPNAKAGNQLGYASRLIGSGRHADAEKLLRELLGGVVDYQARRHLLGLYQGLQRRESFDKLALESLTRYPQDAILGLERENKAVFKVLDGQLFHQVEA